MRADETELDAQARKPTGPVPEFPRSLPTYRHACPNLDVGFGSIPAWLRKTLVSGTGAVRNLALASGLCQAIAMAEKRTKADRLERQTEQLGKRVDRHPDQIEKKKTTREEVTIGRRQEAAK